ncbi:MAG: peptide chain release factor H [Bacteroidota bacterium]
MKTKEYIIQISSGRGPVECCWVVTQVLSLFIKEMKKYNILYEVLNDEPGPESGTLLSATIKVSGTMVEKRLSSWEGSILWIGQSPFRIHNRRKNWYIGITSDQPSKPNQIKDKDISFQTLRSGGPGGQHVNKVSTAVRAIHEPSGLSVLSSDTRSQIQNKKIAVQRLNEMFSQLENNTHRETQKNLWGRHNSLIRGNPVRTYSGQEFKEVFRQSGGIE